MAPAHLDAHRAGAAVPAGTGRGARLAATATSTEPAQGAGLPRQPRRVGTLPGPDRRLRRVRLDLVQRGVPAAVHLAHRLPGSADNRVRQGAAGQADQGAAQSRPTRRARPAGEHAPAGRGRPAARRAAASALAHHRPGRGARGDRAVGREGLQPRGRQPAVPRVAAGRTGADRRRKAAELSGIHRDHRGNRASATGRSPTTRSMPAAGSAPAGSPVSASTTSTRSPRATAKTARRSSSGPTSATAGAWARRASGT